jgi:hypothetical protein
MSLHGYLPPIAIEPRMPSMSSTAAEPSPRHSPSDSFERRMPDQERVAPLHLGGGTRFACGADDSGDQCSVVLVSADVADQLSMMVRARSGATSSSLLVRTTTVSPVLGSKAAKDV